MGLVVQVLIFYLRIEMKLRKTQREKLIRLAMWVTNNGITGPSGNSKQRRFMRRLAKINYNKFN